MDTFALFAVCVIAWFVLEFARIFSGRPSVSSQVKALYDRWPPLGMLTGLVVGILLAHFFFPA